MKLNCTNGCPPNVDLRTCTKAIEGNCPYIASRKGGLYFRETSMFNDEE